MLFNSSDFLLFFLIVYLLYWRIPDFRRQNLLLLLASYVFYGAWDIRFLPLIFSTGLINYGIGSRIAREARLPQRKLWLTLGVSISLATLAFFKYFNFGIESAASVLRHLGIQPHLSTLNIILPVGISFYTFHEISYLVDLYRREGQLASNFVSFALYVAYFPQLVAGPIQQSRFLLPELEKPRTITGEDLRLGAMWILLGYAKKVAFADTLAPLVDRVFDHPAGFTGATFLMATLAFATQIYGDFAGYTLIARGLSQLMGMPLIENFRRPFLASDPRDFWRRWHMSLSSWLRNYLYLPLGGNRLGTFRTHINLMLTMLLGGLWHGASWNFVLWGGYHGALLSLSHALGFGSKSDQPSPAIRALRILVTFLLTLFGWLLFRARAREQIVTMIQGLLFNFRWDQETTFIAIPTLTIFALLMAYHLWQELSADALVLLEADWRLRSGVYAFLFLVIVAIGFRPVPFVYFQF